MPQLGRQFARSLVNAIYYCSLFYLLMRYAADIAPSIAVVVCVCAAVIDVFLTLIMLVLIELGWL